MRRVEFHYQSGAVHTMELKPHVAANVLVIAEDVWSGRRHGSTAVKLADEDTGLETLINLKRVIHIRDLGLVSEQPLSPELEWELELAEDARPGFWRWTGWLR